MKDSGSCDSGDCTGHRLLVGLKSARSGRRRALRDLAKLTFRELPAGPERAN